MPLLSIMELAQELSVPQETINRLINQKIIIPYGGKARLGEPRFSTNKLQDLRNILRDYGTPKG